MISLASLTLKDIDFDGKHVWPLVITATSSDANISPKVFVYLSAEDMYVGGVYEGVATVDQLDEIPEDSATPTCPYYRLDTVVFHSRSPEERDKLWDDVNLEVTDLNKNLDVTLGVQGTHTSTGD